jgi:hypothetical protein
VASTETLNRPIALLLPQKDLLVNWQENCANYIIPTRSTMPWYNGDYPPSYKNQPPALRNKAVEIANELLLHGMEEAVAIATGLKKARLFFAAQQQAKAAPGKKRQQNIKPPTEKDPEEL